MFNEVILQALKLQEYGHALLIQLEAVVMQDFLLQEVAFRALGGRTLIFHVLEMYAQQLQLRFIQEVAMQADRCHNHLN